MRIKEIRRKKKNWEWSEKRKPRRRRRRRRTGRKRGTLRGVGGMSVSAWNVRYDSQCEISAKLYTFSSCREEVSGSGSSVGRRDRCLCARGFEGVSGMIHNVAWPKECLKVECLWRRVDVECPFVEYLRWIVSMWNGKSGCGMLFCGILRVDG